MRKRAITIYAENEEDYLDVSFPFNLLLKIIIFLAIETSRQI